VVVEPLLHDVPSREEDRGLLADTEAGAEWLESALGDAQDGQNRLLNSAVVLERVHRRRVNIELEHRPPSPETSVAEASSLITQVCHQRRGDPSVSDVARPRPTPLGGISCSNSWHTMTQSAQVKSRPIESTDSQMADGSHDSIDLRRFRGQAFPWAEGNQGD
jgi:hypothetical protein